MQQAVGFVEELLVFLVEADALDLVGGPEALVQLAAVADVLHLDLGEGAALAGLDVADLHRDPESAVVLEDIAGPDLVAIDLRHGICPIHSSV